MKIIKYSIILACGAFLLPAPPQDHFVDMNGGTRVNLETGEVISAAASAFSDVSGFCQRQPAVCNTAGQVFSSLEIRAKYNFQRLYEWSTSSPTSQNMTTPAPVRDVKQVIEIEQSAQSEFDPVVTGSIKSPAMIIAANSPATPSVNTLNIEDLVPEWRGPVRTSTG